MSDTENQSSGLEKPSETIHQAKQRLEKELKALQKSAKGKSGKAQIEAQKQQNEAYLVSLKNDWDAYRRATADGSDGEAPATETAAAAAAPAQEAAPADGSLASLEQLLAGPTITMREIPLTKKQRKQQEREAQEAAINEETKSVLTQQKDMRLTEQAKILQRLQKYKYDGALQGQKGAELSEVSADGHCLFRAMAEQLNALAASNTKSVHAAWIDQTVLPEFAAKLESQYKLDLSQKQTSGDGFTYQDLRYIAAAWILDHPYDYIPYLLDSEEFSAAGGDIKRYCESLTTSEIMIWGGEPELNALACVFGCRIKVFSAESAPIQIQTNKANIDLGSAVITFHQYWAGHSAHYNATKPAVSNV